MCVCVLKMNKRLKINNCFIKLPFRVNFLKYQKPEKDLSFLKNSETYRTIHHLGQHENGIEKRPAMVVSEEDILKVKRLVEYRVPYHQI